MFKHLQHVNMGYFEHMYHAMHFCILSARAACYFFLHGMYPDIFVFSGSGQIEVLAKLLEERKIEKR